MTKNKVEERRAWAALRRAGLRAVVTKALAGGLAAYLCVRERETLRLRWNCLAAGEARPALSWLGPEPGLPRRQLPAWGKTGLFARRFATYRVALSLPSLPRRGDARSVQGVWQLRCPRVAASARSLGAATETAWRAEREALRTTRGNLRRVLAGHLCRAQLC